MKKFQFFILLLSISALNFAYAGRQLVEFPLVFNIDGAETVYNSSSDAKSPAVKIVAESAAPQKELLKSFLQNLSGAIKSGDKAAIAKYLTRPEDANKAKAFMRMFSIADYTKIPLDCAVRVGKNSYIVPFKPTSKKFRSGMNALVLTKKEGVLKMNLSLRNPIISMLAQSCAAAAPRIKDLSDSDTKALECSGTPFIQPTVVFEKSGSIKKLSENPNVENFEAAKFYHKAQDLFFSYKLEDYAEYMTSPSRKKFSDQYLNMDAKQRKNALSEYFSWKKKYISLLEGGDISILLFKRLKEGKEPQFDSVYIINENGKFKIANFSAAKSNFDLFVHKYLFSSPSEDYCQKILRDF